MVAQGPDSIEVRAVVAFDDDEVAGTRRLSQLDGGLVLGRFVAGFGLCVALELDDDMPARGELAFRRDGLAVAHEEARTVLLERHGVGGDIVLVALGVRHIDVGDPVALGHVGAPHLAQTVMPPLASEQVRGRAHAHPSV
jgi:hypothetical protein